MSGGVRRYINLDHAASAPCLVMVKQAVDALLPWYSSVHRGAGFKSRLATEAYDGARVAVRSFVQARSDDCVLFTRNTTDAINLLASALPVGAAVVAFASEHHANLLPWRRRDVTFLPVPHSPEEALEKLDQVLRWIRADTRLVAVTGASNVTGEIWPYAEIARLAHRHGERVFLDAAQPAPHHPIDMTGSEIDYVAISGHKLYAPFGAGALVGRSDWLRSGEPFLAGGGAVDYVRVDDVLWAELPDRQEAGSPNVLGAVALGVACRTLRPTHRGARRGAAQHRSGHHRRRHHRASRCCGHDCPERYRLALPELRRWHRLLARPRPQTTPYDAVRPLPDHHRLNRRNRIRYGRR